MSDQEATAAAIGGVVAPSNFDDALLLGAFLDQTEPDVHEWQRQILEEIVVEGNFARVIGLRGEEKRDMEQTVDEFIAFICARP